MAGLNRAQQAKLVKQKVKKAKLLAEAQKPLPTPSQKHKQAVRNAFQEDFPHGASLIAVSGDALLCGARAVAASWNAQLPDLEEISVNQLMKISRGPEVTALNAEVGLTNTNNFFVDQLATMVRIAGITLSPTPTNIQLCVIVRNGEPFFVPAPFEGEIEHRVWIENNNAGVLFGADLNHYSGLTPRKAPEQNVEKVSQALIEKAKARAAADNKVPEDEAEQAHKPDDASKNPELEYFVPDHHEDEATVAFEKRMRTAFGDLSFEKEILPSGNRKVIAKVFEALLIDLPTGQMIRAKDTVTEVSLRLDLFRPYVAVTTMHKEDLVEDHEYDSEDHEEDTEDEPRSDMIEKVEACYTYQSLIKHTTEPCIRGIRVMVASRPDKDALPADMQADIDGLHPATLDRIEQIQDAGEVPILLDIFHDDEFIERGVYYNTPVWGQRFANALKNDKCTRVLVAGFEDSVEQFKVWGEFLARNKDPLARFHLGKSRNIFRKAKMADVPDLQRTGFQRMVSFYDINEYLTIQWITHAKEIEILKRDIQVFEDKFHTIRLLEVRTTTEKSTYYGFLNFEVTAFRPREGDMFQFTFNQDDDFGDRNKRYWTFKVVESIGIGPFGEHICGVVTRPWDKTAGEYEWNDPTVIKLHKDLSHMEAQVRIEADAGNLCRMKYVNPSTVDKNITWAFDPLVHDPKDSPSTTWNNRWKTNLLAKRIDQLVPMDFFAFARKQLKDNPQDYMLLDEQQAEAIIDLGYSPGGLKITQGPPGTGKTHTIVESCIPFALTPEHGTHLVFSPSNKGADKIALDADIRFHKLRQNELITDKYPHMVSEENAYVVRLHSKASERQVRDLIIYANVDKPENARPPTFPDDIDDLFDTLSESEAIVHEVLRKSKAVNVPGILDPRVRHLTLSVGARMLQSVGLFPDGKGGFTEPWTDFATKHARFRGLMMRKVKGEQLTPAQKTSYGEAAKALYTEILQKARVVVGTTAAVSTPAIVEILRERVVAITADENGREVEAAMMAQFAARYTQNPCLHLVGDQNQIKPFAQVNQSVLVTAKQKELSLMKRAILAGHPYTMLTKQYRMHSEIVYPASRFFYQKKLTSAPGLDNRLGTSTFKHFMKHSLGGNYSNTIWFDIKAPMSQQERSGKKKRPVYRVYTDQRGSKMCEYQAMYTVDLAVDLVTALTAVKSDGTVGMLTQYLAQHKLHNNALQKMHATKFEGNLNLHADTIAGAQGLEYDYVILDLVVDDRIGMLSHPDIVNVAMTRAKLGFVIIGPMNAIGSASGDARAIRDIKNYYRRSGRVAKITDIWTWPSCNYLTPSALNVPLDVGLVMSALSTQQLLSVENQEDQPRAPRPMERTYEVKISDVSTGEVVSAHAEDQVEPEQPVETAMPEVEVPENQPKKSTRLHPLAIFSGFKNIISLPTPEYNEEDTKPAPASGQDTATGDGTDIAQGGDDLVAQDNGSGNSGWDSGTQNTTGSDGTWGGNAAPPPNGGW